MSQNKKSTPPAPEDKESALEELFLFQLRYREGQLVEVGANKPILLKDQATSWVVYSGYVDVFAVEVKDGIAIGPRTHLFRINAGQALFGSNLARTGHVSFLAIGGSETRVLKIETSRLQQMGQEDEYNLQVANLVDSWVRGLSSCISSSLPPKECVRLEADHEVELPAGGSICAQNQILWIKQEDGQSHFMGNPNWPISKDSPGLPLSNYTWVQATDKSKLKGFSTDIFICAGSNWLDLQSFYQIALHHVELNLQQIALAEKQRLHDKAIVNQKIIGDAFIHLATALAPAEEQALLAIDTQEPLLQACQLVGEKLGLKVQAIPEGRKGQTKIEPIEEIAKTSKFRVRRVALKGKWWLQNHGPLLAYLADNKQPVALLPLSGKRYELHNPSARAKTIVTEEIANTLDYFAYTFYRPFPDQAINAWQLIRFGLQGQSELRTIGITGILVGGLALLVPIATGVIFDRIIPSAEHSQLIQLCLVLFVGAIASALFQVTQNIAILRLRGKLSLTVQAAIWDRLITLPVAFFRRYTTGDLGTRVMGISAIEQTLSEPVISVVLSGLFSVFSFMVLFYYDVSLALAATCAVVVLIIATIWVGRIQVRYQREIAKLRGEIAGIVLQAVTGIAKFRMAGAEGRAFASWAKDFSQLKQTTYKARNTANNLTVFNAGYYIIMSMIIFAAVAFSGRRDLSTGTFLAFNAAFVQLVTAVLILSTTSIGILNILPTYERIQPILQTLPEVNELKAYPGELAGRLEVSHVSFCYKDNDPLVLRDVSLYADPGEFIALVGPSGSGKSTLLRLLLGFETPTSGTIYYDGHDMTGLDIREVRRQIGVVLQNGQLMTGDIFTNIIGSSLLTLDDAWEAARMAGLEEDVKQMPMGLHTVISAGGDTLSGGQRQRLLIARAVVHKPRILFFDEATSALDNRTQAIVSKSLENLQATRIVIAHRLSTIMNANRIYVFQNGQVVQSGTYNELVNQEGIFADLAKRQLV